MNVKRPYAEAFLIGTVATIMVTCTTELGNMTTVNFSTLMNHLVNLGMNYLILLFGLKNSCINPKGDKVPWYLYSAGLLGIVNLTLNFVAVKGAGATVLMVGVIFGQSLLGLIYDLTGFLGLEKRKLTRNNVISILISLAGILLMLSGGTFRFRYMFYAMCAGFAAMTQMVMCTRMSSHKGVFYSTRMNVLVGSIGMVILSIFVFPEDITTGFSLMKSTPIIMVLGGGLCATLCGVGTTIILPRIPAVIASLILATGQISSAVLVDYLLYDRFSLPTLLGVIVMLLGMLVGGREEK